MTSLRWFDGQLPQLCHSWYKEPLVNSGSWTSKLSRRSRSESSILQPFLGSPQLGWSTSLHPLEASSAVALACRAGKFRGWRHGRRKKGNPGTPNSAFSKQWHQWKPIETPQYISISNCHKLFVFISKASGWGVLYNTVLHFCPMARLAWSRVTLRGLSELSFNMRRSGVSGAVAMPPQTLVSGV